MDPILGEFRRQKEATLPSVVAIKSIFSAPGNGESSRTGTGVFVDRALIVTSSHIVGRLSSVRDAEGHATVSLGRTFALTIGNRILKTKVLTVNFAGDVAVLEAEAEAEAEGAGDLPPPLAVSTSAPSQEVPIPVPLMVITRHEGCNGKGVVVMKYGSGEDGSGRTDWPYEVEDGLGWVRYGGDPINDLKIVAGSPWFNFRWQVVGIASSAVGAEPAGSVGGFVVHPLRIRSAVEYAKTKDASDPVVVDPWITAPPTFADYEPKPEECFNNVPEADFVATMYLNLPF